MGYGPRPTGVTILAILSALAALVFLAATAVVFLGVAITTNAGLMVVAIVSLIFMIVYFLLAFGFWGGRKWAWGLGIVFAIISIVWSIASYVLYPDVSSIGGLIIDILIPLIILIYLNVAGVKKFFKGSAPAH